MKRKLLVTTITCIIQTFTFYNSVSQTITIDENKVLLNHKVDLKNCTRDELAKELNEEGFNVAGYFQKTFLNTYWIFPKSGIKVDIWSIAGILGVTLFLEDQIIRINDTTSFSYKDHKKKNRILRTDSVFAFKGKILFNGNELRNSLLSDSLYVESLSNSISDSIKMFFRHRVYHPPENGFVISFHKVGKNTQLYKFNKSDFYNIAAFNILKSYNVGETTEERFLSDGWNVEDPFNSKLGITEFNISKNENTNIYKIGFNSYVENKGIIKTWEIRKVVSNVNSSNNRCVNFCELKFERGLLTEIKFKD